MPSDDFIVTPWHVEGEIDYDKLIKRFGTQKISPQLIDRIKKTTGDVHFMLRRGVFFSHRDMNVILDEYEKGNKFFLYTGRGPSGHTHIGHLVPWVFAKWLQDKFGVNMYFQLTDDEKFFSKQNMKLDETKKFAYENALDFIALGFKPEKRQKTFRELVQESQKSWADRKWLGASGSHGAGRNARQKSFDEFINHAHEWLCTRLPQPPIQ